MIFNWIMLFFQVSEVQRNCFLKDIIDEYLLYVLHVLTEADENRL